MGSVRRGLVVAALATAVFIVPAGAQASKGLYAQGSTPLLKTKGTHKYGVSIFQVPLQAGPEIEVSKGPNTNDYLAFPDLYTSTRIRADYRGLGKIDLTFHPDGSAFADEPLPHHCTGTPDQARSGTWKGTFKFRGEGGFTKVSETSIKGQEVQPGSFTCTAGAVPKYTLQIDPGGADNAMALVTGNGKGDGHLVASTSGPVQQLSVQRQRLHEATLQSTNQISHPFTASSDLKRAKLQLKTGIGRYRSTQPGGGGTSPFTGDLKINFLGAPSDRTVKFAGQAVFATLQKSS